MYTRASRYTRVLVVEFILQFVAQILCHLPRVDLGWALGSGRCPKRLLAVFPGTAAGRNVPAMQGFLPEIAYLGIFEMKSVRH